MMTEPPRGFPPEEFAGRLARARVMMAAAGLDGLLLTTEPEFRYFSGFLTQFWQSPTRPWFLLLPADEGAPVAVIPSIGADAMRRGWIGDIRCWSSPNPADEGLSLLAEAIRERVGPAARLGLPSGAETHLRLPLDDLARLKRALPDVSWTGDADIMRRLRMVKSEAEVAKTAHICALVSDVFERLPTLIRPGMSEREIFRRFKIACLRVGADDVPYLVGGSGAGGVGDIISPPGDRRVGAGDVLMLDTGAVFDGYFCDFDRNYSFGAPDDTVRNAYRIAHDATAAGFDAARPGARACDVFHAMNGLISAALGDAGGAGGGVGRMGHGLGMQLTEWPSNAAWDETEIVPGMVLTLEPGLTIAPGRVMVHEENIVIRADGAHYLTRRAPPEIPVIAA